MLKDCIQRVSAVRPSIINGDPVNPNTGKVKVLPVDPFAYSSGLVNACGFNANDVYAYEHAASDSVAESILHRINPSPDPDVDKDVSLEEKVANMVPRGMCTPAEYLHYCDRITTRLYNKQKAKLEAEKKSDTISFVEDEVKNSD